MLGDSLSSDDQAKNTLHNEIEMMRDPSHVKMYGLAELQDLVSSSGFKIESYEIFEDRRDFDWWMSVIIPPRDVAKQIRSKLIDSMRDDRMDLDPQLDGKRLSMKRRSVVLAAAGT